MSDVRHTYRRYSFVNSGAIGLDTVMIRAAANLLTTFAKVGAVARFLSNYGLSGVTAVLQAAGNNSFLLA